MQEATGGYRRVQEGTGGCRRVQEGAGGYRRVQEGLGKGASKLPVYYNTVHILYHRERI